MSRGIDIRYLRRWFWLSVFVLIFAAGRQSVRAEQAALLTGEPRLFLDGEEFCCSEAAEELEAFVETRLGRRIVLGVGENRYYCTAEELGLTWTNPELLQAVCRTAEYVQEQPGAIAFDFHPAFDINPDIIVPYLTRLIEMETAAPVNGTAYKDGDTVYVTDGEAGRAFSIEQVMAELVPLLLQTEETGRLTYEFPMELIEPDFTSKTVSFSETPLGEYTTYNLGIPGRINNIEISAGGINGTVVMPGEELSALDMYGPVTAECGYQEAPVYNGGRQLMGIGGGICQTTTTLYNACLRAELEIVYRRSHSMLVSYVPPSLDAMVDYATKSDFVARNNTEYPIYLEASTGQDDSGRSYINVRIWGVETRPANRTVEFTYEVLSCEFPANLFRVNAANDSVCTVGLVGPEQKIYAEVEAHPFVQSRAYKIVKTDGQEQSREMLPGTYGSYDQYKPMEGTIYHASDCLVTYWVVADPDTYLGKRVHYQVMFLNGQGWDPEDPMGWY